MRAGIGPRRDASIPLSISHPPLPLDVISSLGCTLTPSARPSSLSPPPPPPWLPSQPFQDPCPCGALTPTIYTTPSLRRNVRRLTMIQIPEIHPHRSALCGQASVCVRARVCPREQRAYTRPGRANTARHHFNEDVITDVSALESAMRPWRDTPSRIIGCLINHCAMHAFLPLFPSLCLCLHEARCVPAAHCARSVSTPR